MMLQEFTLNEITGIANQLAALIRDGAAVVAFHGDMGAGKTTLISALCKSLGSEDAISSPTFSIINQYNAGEGKMIYHMDWYRIKDEQEAIEAGVEDALYSGNICLVEWPEKAPGLLPGYTLQVYLATVDACTRMISTSKDQHLPVMTRF